MRVASPFACIAFSCVVQSLAISHVARNGVQTQYGFGTTTFTGDNFCGKTSFHHETSSDNPLLEDCQQVFHYLNSARHSGDQFIGWDKDHLQSDYAEVMKAGTCALAAKPVDAIDNSPAVMTWGDLADIVQEVIKLGGGKKIRASGYITCQVPDNAYNRQTLTWTGPWGKRKFEWQLYRPGDVPVIKW
ncbi:hypothetical protein F4860DRAFT_518033 [Xylaria cubensis]|nr:hypothetical protein F4860DRAFT_518033 [Xylaria cubensis]